jgi:5-methylcytosine-specific restriction protein A
VSWETSDRRSRLPDNWPALVRTTAARARRTSKIGIAQCEARLPRSGKRCPRPGTDCDHKVAGDDHSLANLQWLCGHHHDQKTAQEARQGRAAQRKSKYRPSEDHPGTVR